MNKIFLQGEVKSLGDSDFEVIASAEQVDRLGDKISAEGWYLNNYKKNPVMLWAHNNSIPPVAKADKVWVENKRLMVKGTFAPTPFAQEIRMLVENGFLNTVSVGFLPLKADEKGNIEIEEKMYSRMTDEEVKKSIYDNEYGMKFEKQELLEVSWVDVPALPQALITARKEGLVLITKELEDIKTEKNIEQQLKKIDYMEKAINALESDISLLKEENSAKGIVPEKSKRSHAPEKISKRITPELRLLRIAIKALEQVIIKEKVKGND